MGKQWFKILNDNLETNTASSVKIAAKFAAKFTCSGSSRLFESGRV